MIAGHYLLESLQESFLGQRFSQETATNNAVSHAASFLLNTLLIHALRDNKKKGPGEAKSR